MIKYILFSLLICFAFSPVVNADAGQDAQEVSEASLDQKLEVVDQEQVSLDDEELDFDSFMNEIEELEEAGQNDLPLMDKIKLAWFFVKFKTVEHLEENKKAYVVGISSATAVALLAAMFTAGYFTGKRAAQK